jgi:alpha-L-arabinofuranosidase
MNCSSNTVSLQTFFIALLGLCVTANAGEVEIMLDVQNTGKTISPLLFGHNVEVTRRGIWSGLSAEMVANRKFASVSNNMPTRWQVNGADSQVRIDDSVSYTGKQSVCINVKTEGIATGIIQQQAFLAFRKDTRYDVRVWLKTKVERKVQVRISGVKDEPFFHKEYSLSSGDWQLLDGEFISPITEENCRLEITSDNEGQFWIGAVSVKPKDTLNGMRRDVIELLKTIKPGCLRYPGGCYAEFYEWQEGLLPVDQRSPIPNTGLDFLFRDTDGTDTHEVGINEFISLCREVNCEPVITVRLSENTPENAAALVEYCNGNAKTKWGKIRAEQGYPEPYNVRYWFVGNELWAFGRGKAQGAEGCADQSRLFAQAMKEVDKNIRLIACTVFDSGDAKSDWNQPLLESSGQLFYACSAHKYILDQLPLKTDDDITTIAKSPTQNVLHMLQTARNFIDKQTDNRQLGITFDEWNTLWGHSGSITMGLYVASMLNMLSREAESLGIDMACYFMPLNEGAIKITPLTAGLDSAGYFFDLFKVHQGNQILKIPETDSNSDIDACASVTTDNKRIYATLVNRNIKTEYTVTLSLANLAIAKNPIVTVSFLIPNALKIEESIFHQKTEVVTLSERHQIKVILPPGSIARVTIMSLDSF